jgi:hypothetical protein
VIDALIDLPSHLRDRLASALESGLLGTSPAAASVQSVLGYREDMGDLVAALLELAQLGVTGPAAAAWLRTPARAAARTPKTDLVWSRPEVPGLHARDTMRVYEELLGCAERSILASTYAFFDGPKAFEVLARRMDPRPTLRVTLLLNIQRKRSDTTASDQLVRRFADRSGTPTGADPCMRVCFMILDRLILKVPAGFSTQKRSSLMMRLCS